MCKYSDIKTKRKKNEICKFKPPDHILSKYFCLGSASKGFTDNEMSEISLNSTVYNFLIESS